MKEFWDQRYARAEYVYGREPNVFFADKLAEFRPKGRVLLAAEGEGRNAVYAARLGLEVYAFDQSAEGRRKALEHAATAEVSMDYQVGDFGELEYEAESFDVLGLIYAHFPPDVREDYNRRLASYVKPGGLVIFEAFGDRHLPLRAANPSVGGPGSQGMLFTEAEVQRSFTGYELLQLEQVEVELAEGAFHRGVGSVIRMVGRRRA